MGAVIRPFPPSKALLEWGVAVCHLRRPDSPRRECLPSGPGLHGCPPRPVNGYSGWLSRNRSRAGRGDKGIGGG
jgi:hypothetical protein